MKLLSLISILGLILVISCTQLQTQPNNYEGCLTWCQNNPNTVYGPPPMCKMMCKAKYQGKIVSLGDKAKACADVVTLGGEWTVKEGALQTAKGILVSAKKLQKADPRLVGLAITEHTAELGLEAANKSLYAAQKASEGIAAGTKLLGEIASAAFNIQSMSFETTSNQLLKGQVPPIRVVGTIAGQHFDVTIHNTDFSDADSFVNSVLKNLKI